LVLRSMSH